MATTAPTRPPRPGPIRPREPLDRRAVRGRHPPRRGPPRRRRPARRPDRQAHRPFAARTSSSSTSQSSRDKIWWGAVNRPISEAHYDRLRARLVDYAASKDLYSQDCFIGAAPAHRRSLRVYTETAWASIFARNLFRRPTADQLARLRAELHDHLRPVVPGRPRDRGDAHRDGHPRPPASGWRSSSSARNTPARSRRARSRS